MSQGDGFRPSLSEERMAHPLTLRGRLRINPVMVRNVATARVYESGKRIGTVTRNEWFLWTCGNGRFYSNSRCAAVDLMLLTEPPRRVRVSGEGQEREVVAMTGGEK